MVVEPDHKKAIEYYRMAIDKGEERAVAVLKPLMENKK